MSIHTSMVISTDPARSYLSSIFENEREISLQLDQASKKFPPKALILSKQVPAILDSVLKTINLSKVPESLRPQVQKVFRDLTQSYIQALPSALRVHKLYRDIADLIQRWKNSCIHIHPNIQFYSCFHITEKDFKEIQHSLHLKVFCPKVPVCFDYVFFLLNERRAFDWIFNPLNSEAEEFLTNPVSFLHNWDYELTSTPIPGDLVLYCSKHSEALSPHHIGLWVGNNTVLSKWGKDDVFIHPLRLVPAFYGNKVYFFHKQAKTFLAESQLKELSEMSKSIEDFSHPACRSPLSVQGSIYKILEIFAALPQGVFLNRSLYNRDYTRRYHIMVLNEIQGLCPSFFGSNLELIEEIKRIILEKQKEFPLRSVINSSQHSLLYI